MSTTKTDCQSYYQFGRQFAGLSQEEAAARLHCSVKSLYNYENGAKVPDDIVSRMADEYEMPTLAVWHLKRSDNPLARFIPDVIEPQTLGDVGMQTVLSHAEVEHALDLFTRLMRDGKITPDEHADLSCYARMMRVVSGHALSAALYAETEIIRQEKLAKIAS